MCYELYERVRLSFHMLLHFNVVGFWGQGM
jgi:hypothetical protein